MQSYIIEDNIALRGWINRPYTYIRHKHGYPHDISKEEFFFMLDCDGAHEITESALAESLMKKGLIRNSKEKEGLSKWQEYKFYPHIYYRDIMFEITERCNYNCRHCFNAESEGVPKEELSVDMIVNLANEAAKQGVSGVVISGGEPMHHPHFMEIIKQVAGTGLKVNMINTNGAYINEEILNEFAEMNIFPVFRISFDGMGFHDWMRGVKGAQEKALKAISLCIEKKFMVMIQTNINKRNLDMMKETIDYMDAVGVTEMRVIRTTEAPRWIRQAGNDCLSWEEYYDAALELIKYYDSKKRNMRLVFWQFANVEQKTKRFQAAKIAFKDKESASNILPCQERINVCANGQLYPCLQMSGAFKERGICLADIKREKLLDVLIDSPYMRIATLSGNDLKNGNDRCRNCPFSQYCAGGCPAVSLIMHGKYDGPDDSACIFFRDGYYKKIKEILKDYTDVMPMPDDIDSSYLEQFDYRIGKFLKINPKDFT